MIPAGIESEMITTDVSGMIKPIPTTSQSMCSMSRSLDKYVKKAKGKAEYSSTIDILEDDFCIKFGMQITSKYPECKIIETRYPRHLISLQWKSNKSLNNKIKNEINQIFNNLDKHTFSAANIKRQDKRTEAYLGSWEYLLGYDPVKMFWKMLFWFTLFCIMS